MSSSLWSSKLFLISFVAAIPTGVFANDILSTEGFTPCQNNPTVSVNAMNIQFDRSTNLVTFDVSGTSKSQQYVNASLTVSAYGHEIYSKEFNPCDPATLVEQLCPVPEGTFSASGTQSVPAKYADMIPAIAYQVPDLGGAGKLQLYTGANQSVACVESTVGNGRTLNMPAVKYVAAGIAAGALVLSGLSAASGGAKGGSTSSPTFTEVMHWFQGIAMNGMLSVNYPGVYRSFSANFGFSTGLIPWNSLQETIDNFRASTGGNLTDDSIQYLHNSTLVYADSTNVTKRSLPFVLNRALLFTREVSTTVNGTSITGSGNGTQASAAANAGPTSINSVKGIAAYAETLMVPESNTFMNVLLIFAIVLAAITAGILLFKVVLEAWALFGSFPKKLEGFRKRYWWTLAKTITNLILVLYGTWTLYCVYMFKDEKSGWAAKALAGVTLGLFTAVLIGFTIRIWLMAQKAKKMEGDASASLYEDKEVWVRYSIFYDNYKKSYWWLFVPIIIYMFAKGCIIAGGEGHGMFQCAGQLVIDSLLLILLLFLRPYSLKSGNWINIIVQVVRVLSVVCILIFVEELGFSQTTQTITGVVLIVVQGVLTAVLAILIAVNALINCCKLNPHRRARKEAEKLRQDELTPLDAHNSWLMQPVDQKKPGFDVTSIHSRGRSNNGYDMVSTREESNAPLSRLGAGMGQAGHERSRSHSPDEWMQYHQRQPALPDLEYRGRGIGSAM